MLESEGEFGDGLVSLLKNGISDDVDAEAALHVVAETILLHRNWLKANLK